MSNLFKSVYGTLDKSGESEKSLNAPESKEDKKEEDEEKEEGTNPPAGVEGEDLYKQTTPSYQVRSVNPPQRTSPSATGTDAGGFGPAGAPRKSSLSQSLFPVITPIQKSLAQTHGYGDYTVDHVGKSCGVCGCLSKSLKGPVCETCIKSMNSVAWHKSHLE